MFASRLLPARSLTRLVASLAAVLGLALSMVVAVGLSPTAPGASAMVGVVKSNSAADWAMSRKGDPYSYGGDGPTAFDCSGLTRWAYAHVGKSLPHSSSAQAARSIRVSRKNARRGDLVFFGSSVYGAYHVGIYAGHGYLWHAPFPGTRVRKERIWTTNVFFGRVR